VRVLVTGAGGYIGRAVVEALRQAGHEPVAMLRSERSRLPVGVEIRTSDLLVADTLVKALRDVDAVCHLAGLTRARESWEQPLRYFAVNVTGTVGLLEAMAARGVNILVFASTGSIYGTPESQPMGEDLPDAPPHPYAASKQAAESVIEWQARAGGIGALALRLFNVAAGADPDPTRMVPRVLAAAAGQSPSVEVNGDGSAVRDFLHVDDAARAFVAALDSHAEVGQFRRYNIGSGTGASVLDVVAAAERVTGRSVPIVHRPPAAEPQALVCDPSRAAAELGWKPRRSDLDTIVQDAWTSRTQQGRQ
jgi:UDP-glucose 4-epimerase